MTKTKKQSRLVRDFDYERLQDLYYEAEYSDDYEATKYQLFQGYDELETFLKTQFIPKNIVMQTKKGTQNQQLFPFISLSKILGLNLSPLELKHTLSFLEKENILVRGINSDIEEVFENYDYYRNYKTPPLSNPLSQEELQAKFILYASTKDKTIREQLIVSNMRLVPWFAIKMFRKYSDYNLDVYDLQQYGYEGLIQAVDEFDLTKGCKFSTFATYKIRLAILNGIYNFVDVTTEGHNNWIVDFIKFRQIIRNETGEKVENNPQLIEYLIDLMIASGKISAEYREKNIKRVKILLSSFSNNYLENLDTDFIEKSHFNLPDSSPFYPIPEQLATYSLLKDTVKETLSTLNPKEEKIIRLRFGFEDGQKHSLEEITKHFNVSCERIRQIEVYALRKIRGIWEKRNLKDFLDDDFFQTVNDHIYLIKKN